MFSTLLPPEGSKTVWEDRCILVHLDNAKDVSSSVKLLPSVLLTDDLPADALPQRAAVYPPDASGDEDGTGRASLLERLASHLQAAVSPLAAPLAFVWSRFLSGCQPRASAAPLEWHPRRPWLAAADGRGRVQVLDLGPSLRPPANGLGSGRPELLVSGPGSLKAVLVHEALQGQALSLAWCPTSPGLLAVGAAGAVGLWALAGEARPPLAAAGRAAGPWLRLLRTRVGGAGVTGLSWSPDGRLLAAASPSQAGLQVWDIATGSPTTVSAGPAAFDTVRWSPCGNYVFAAGTGSRHFYIFETHRWTWARWETGGSGGAAAAGAADLTGGPPGGPPSIVAAVWAPYAPGRNPILLAALSGQSYLVAVHLVDSPPGLTAQLLPVSLPELHRAARGGVMRSDGGGGDAAAGPSRSAAAASTLGSSAVLDGDSPAGGGGGAAAASVADLAWDPQGDRLAVVLAPTHSQGSHFVALYSTTTNPLVSARLIGYARPPERLCAAATAAAAAPGAAAAAASTPSAAHPQAAEGSDDLTQTAAPPGPAATDLQPPAALRALPGGLTAARLAPLSGSGPGGGPLCVISARVGKAGIYNLPCYF